MEQLKVAVIGLGRRGHTWCRISTQNEYTRLVAICDTYTDYLDKTHSMLKEMELEDTIEYSVDDYHKLLDKNKIDIAIIVVSWEKHVDIAVDFMNAGIITALEVGGAYTIEDSYRLIRAYESTKTPFFFMENCCFGKRELMILNMVNQGVFGEIVHCCGAYSHDLRKQIAEGGKNHHYRQRNYRMRNCDNYPTHDLGPISRILKINHGNRLVSLVSCASKAAGMAQYIKDYMPEETNRDYKQGDIVNTIITCAGGETILLTLDTTLPRAYSRGFTVRGTKGMYFEDNDSIYLNEDHYPKYDWQWRPLWGNAEQYEEKYLDELWRQDIDTNKEHGGIDELMFSEFIRCVRENLPMPIDVYDAATWMAVSVLSEISIAKGGMPVEIPDFTNGKWLLKSEER